MAVRLRKTYEEILKEARIRTLKFKEKVMASPTYQLHAAEARLEYEFEAFEWQLKHPGEDDYVGPVPPNPLFMKKSYISDDMR